MKPTKQIKTAFEFRLGVTESEYEVLHMAHIYGERNSRYDVAIINIIPTCTAYVIRVWYNGGSTIRKIKLDESYEDAFTNFLTLKE